MSEGLDVLCLGELNVDIIIDAQDAKIEVGSEHAARAYKLCLGSSTAICAVGLARLGLKVRFVGAVGDDTFGEFALQALSSEGVDVSRVRRVGGAPTGLTLSFTKGTDRALLTVPGLISSTTAEDLDVMGVLAQAGARHLHCSSYYLQSGLRPSLATVFRAARDAGMTISLDTGHDPDELWDGGIFDVLPYVDVFLPNEVEVRSIAARLGHDTEPELTYKAAARIAALTRMVVAKMGHRGSMAVRRRGDGRGASDRSDAGHGNAGCAGLGGREGRDECAVRDGCEAIVCPAYDVEVTDTTGAGDAFDAGFIYAMLRGHSMRERLAIGNACAALSATGTGGTEKMANLETLVQFLHDQGEPEPAESLKP